MNSPVHTRSFCKALYCGDILESIIFPYPQMHPEEAESVRIMLDTIEKFKGEMNSAQWDKEGEFPAGFIQNLSQIGLLGLAIPQDKGGLGLSNTGYVRIMQEIGGMDPAVGVLLGAHQSIGLKGLTLFGTKEQQEKYYPRLTTGELIACFALTEPGSGSDAGSIQTKAVLSSDGKHFIVNGQKLWISNGSIANFITAFVKTDEPSITHGSSGTKEEVTALIIELPTSGISFGSKEDKMGIRASSTTSIFFENAKVPVENVLGQRGKGFKVAMEVLNNGRLGLAGGCVGSAKQAIKLAIEHATQRKQFQKSISQLGMIQSKIGRMLVDTFVAESMVYMTTSLIDRKEYDYSLESAISKIFATETLWKVSNDALQIYGGMGYMKECPLEKMVRDSRINLIFEGTNEILRLFVALAGLQGPGQELTEVAKAIKEPIKQIGILSGFAVKTLRLNVLGGSSMTQTHPLLKREAGMFEDYVSEFALQCQKLLQRHGKHIADRQFACKRVADIAIDLYGMACVLSRVTALLNKQGAENCEIERAITASFFMRANRRIRGCFKSIDRNDDDQIKLIADKHYELGKYAWDVI